MKKRLLVCMALVLVLAFGLSACGKGGNDSGDKSGDSNKAKSGKLAIESATIYDKDGVKVTVNDKVEKSALGDFTFTLDLDNGSEVDWTVSVVDFSVEGAYADMFCLGSVEAAGGNKGSGEFSVDNTYMEELHLSTLGTMKFRLHFDSKDGSADSFYSDEIVVKTTNSGQETPQFPTEGVTVIDKDGIKVVGLGFNDGALGKEYRFYIENNTDNYINVDFDTDNLPVLNGDVQENMALVEDIPENTKTISVVYLDGDEFKPYFDAGIESFKANIVVAKDRVTDLSDEILAESGEVELNK